MTLDEAVAVVIARAGALDSLAGDLRCVLGMSADEGSRFRTLPGGWNEL